MGNCLPRGWSSKACDVNMPQHPAHRVVWQVRIQDDGDDYFYDYSPEHSRLLEGAWQHDVDHVELEDEFGYVFWEVSLHRLVQYNSATQTPRPVRRIIVTHS